jgi:pyridoxamine 5'-phosphate oxidase
MFWLARLVALPALWNGITESDLAEDPIDQFNRWHALALRLRIPNANAVALATSSPDGAPSVRMVLLKQIRREGLVFFTNYESRKAEDLERNPRAAVVAYWRGLERQVRVAGPVCRVTREESEAYFATRPRGSQLGAWCSQQSREVQGRSALDHSLQDVRRKFQGSPIPCPPFWGGYRLIPETVEVWQGRAARLHDRFVYERKGQAWMIRRLFP